MHSETSWKLSIPILARQRSSIFLGGFAYQAAVCGWALEGSVVTVTVLVLQLIDLRSKQVVFLAQHNTQLHHTAAQQKTAHGQMFSSISISFLPPPFLMPIYIFFLPFPGGQGTNRHQTFRVCHPAAAGPVHLNENAPPREWAEVIPALTHLTSGHTETQLVAAAVVCVCVSVCVLLYGSQKDTETNCWDQPAVEPGQHTSTLVPSCKELFTECVNCCWLSPVVAHPSKTVT